LVKDLAAIVAVVALGTALGLLVPRCSLDVSRPAPVTTTTDYRDAPGAVP
jgi:hypothetical protein